MPENDTNTGDEKLLILPLGEESKKITQVISNDTARQIIELLAGMPLSASDIAERLQAPLTTITYNLENLENVGLVKIERIKYSEKGREIKVYAPVRKLIVVVPEKTDRSSVTDLIKKYMGVILAAVFASVLIEFLMRNASKSTERLQGLSYSLNDTLVAESAKQTANTTLDVPYSVMNETARSVEGYKGLITPSATPIPTDAVAIPAATQAPAATPFMPPSIMRGGDAGAPEATANFVSTILTHPGIMFLLGCLFAVALFLVMDYFRKGKNG